LGVKEINVIAQDTTAYGTDIASPVTLPELLSRIASIGVPWVRLMYTHPAHITPELLSVIASEEHLVPYLDVPIQHISDPVLALMGRGIDGGRIRLLLQGARASVPGITIRSSVIVGFPGESDAAFCELLEFVEDGAVDYLGVFEYSPEPGTPAFEFPERVPREVAAKRAAAIAAAMEAVAVRNGQRMVGESATVLVDDAGERVVGRTAGQAWEIDGQVLLSPATDRLVRGAFEDVRITGVSGFDLLGTPQAHRAEGGAPPDQ
jgi:ribosomal protein S12 methylthiotransferase